MPVIDLSMLPYRETNFRDYLDSVCETHELDYAAYAGTNPASQTVHGFVNYPDEWKIRYAEKRFEAKDPALLLASRSIAPVNWRRFRREPDFRKVFDEAHEFGISEQGMTIPVRGPFGDVGLFSVTRDCTDREWALLMPKIMSDLQHAAVHLHDNVIRSQSLTAILKHPSLSRRESEILQWVAAGKSQQDVADILAISHRTVEVHLRSAREKLGALTTPQAVGRAISLGMIYPT